MARLDDITMVVPTDVRTWQDEYGVWHAEVPRTRHTRHDKRKALRAILVMLTIRAQRQHESYASAWIRMTRVTRALLDEHTSYGTSVYTEAPRVVVP